MKVKRAEFLTKMCRELKKWDDTRLYIGNTGYGLGHSGDIYDVHRYWGWYYNTFLTYLNMRDKAMWQNPGRVQPITFTECVYRNRRAFQPLFQNQTTGFAEVLDRTSAR